MGMRNDRIHRVRMRRAVAASALMTALVLCACALSPQKAACANGEAVASYAGAAWEALKEGVDAGAAIEHAGLVRIGSAEVPAWFSDEVMDAARIQELWTDQDQSVVGFTLPMGAPEAQETLAEQLDDRGWHTCASGMDGVATYMKEGGEVRWMMVECTEAGGEATVVLRIRRA